MEHDARYAQLRHEILLNRYATRSGPGGETLQANVVAEAENTLLTTGLLLVCLAVEHALGNPEAAALVIQTLDGLQALFKQTGEFAGYPIRYDPVSLGVWTAGVSSRFAPNVDGSYEYITSTYAQRSIGLLPFEVVSAWPAQDKNGYAAEWNAFAGTYRAWEPSGDEIVGLAAGYGVVYELLADVPDARAKVSAQVSALASYLSAHGYFLLRPPVADNDVDPHPGLVARGAAIGTVAGEFALQTLFQQVTDDPHAADADTPAVLKKLGVWHVVSASWAVWEVAGAVTAPLLVPLTALAADELGIFEPTFIVRPDVCGQAMALLTNSNVFDGQFMIDPAKTSADRQEIALGHLLRALPARDRLKAFYTGMGVVGPDTIANAFPPYLALAAISSTDADVIKTFVRYVGARRHGGFSTKHSNGPTGAWVIATGVLFGSNDEAGLVGGLNAVEAYLSGREQQQPGITVGDMLAMSHEALYHMTAIALAWLYAHRQAQLRTPVATAGYPLPPADFTAINQGIAVSAPRSPVPSAQLTLPDLGLPETDSVLVGPQDGAVAVALIDHGDDVEIAASGAIVGQFPATQTGPDGAPGPAPDITYPRFDTGSRQFALLARFGAHGAYLHAGSHLPRRTYLGAPAVLYLRVNSDGIGGSGQLTATVSIWRKRGAPIRHGIRHSNGAWQPANDVRSQFNTPATVTALTAAAVSSNVQFMIGSADAHLWHTIRHADSGWDPLGDASRILRPPRPMRAIAAAGVGEDAQFMLVTDNGQLWHTIRHGNGDWDQLGDAGAILRPPQPAHEIAATAVGSDVQYLISTLDGHLWHTIRHANGDWDPLGDLGAVLHQTGVFRGVAAATTGTVAQFLGCDVAGHLWHTIRHANGDWDPLGDATHMIGQDRPMHVVTAAGIAADAHFVLLSTDGRVWHTIRHESGGWDTVENVSGKLQVGPLLEIAVAPSGTDVHTLICAK